MPPMPRELAVGGGEEEGALLIVLADEQHEGRGLAIAEGAVVPPPGQEGVVAMELVVVLVETSGAVVLDEDQPTRRLGVIAGDLEDGVRADRAGVVVMQTLG